MEFEKSLADGFKQIGKKVGLPVMAILVLTATIYTIETGYVGVLSSGGKYNMEEVPPGIHFKIPVYQEIKKFDTRVHTVSYVGSATPGYRGGVIVRPSIVVLDRKNLDVAIELSVLFKPSPTDAAEILKKYGPDYFEKAINPRVRDIVRDVVGKHSAETIALERTMIAAEIRESLDKKFDGSYFKIVDINLRHIIPPRDHSREDPRCSGGEAGGAAA
jgi:regulator of protease activity HflC (stomatin/prohibitin superfamily)